MKESPTAGKIWGIIYPVLLYFLIQAMVLSIIDIMIIIIEIRKGMPNYMEVSQQIYMDYILLFNLFAGLVAIPIFLLLYIRDQKRSILKGIIKKYENVFWLKYFFIIPFGVFAMMSANYFVTLLSMFMPSFMIDSYKSVQNALFGSTIIVQILTSGVMAPVVEELIFRGLVYSRIKRISSVSVAAVLSSLVFGIYHGNWIQAPYAFIIGLSAVFLYEKYKSIFAPILFHATSNLASVLLVYVFSKMPNSAADGTVAEPSGLATMMVLFMLIFFTGACTAAFGFIINNRVNPKEIKNELE